MVALNCIITDATNCADSVAPICDSIADTNNYTIKIEIV
ncbi:hypothetical protein M2101_002080 [Parabacteroides sp. PM5-20]|nr:hypothetical protein [Parabacteroides sp. PM5-20]